MQIMRYGGSRFIRNGHLLCLGLSSALLAPSARAAPFQVNLSGTLYYTAGSRWDSAVHTGTPFVMSLTYSTPPPQAFSFPGYTTYEYPGQSAAMSFQVGPYLFSAGDIQLTVWNNSSY